MLPKRLQEADYVSYQVGKVCLCARTLIRNHLRAQIDLAITFIAEYTSAYRKCGR